MNEREQVARRVAETCAELRLATANAGLEMLNRILGMAILEAKSHEAPTLAPLDERR